jgi:quinol monooxygenase YgiN
MWEDGMSIVVLLDLAVKPECVEELKTAIGGLLPDTRAYDGCGGVYVEQDLDDPSHIVLIERWVSKQHFEKYFGWRTETGAVDQLMAFLTAPPKTAFLNDTAI